MAGGLAGDHDNTFLNVTGLVYVATQWDVDQAGAEAILARLAENEQAPGQ